MKTFKAGEQSLAFFFTKLSFSITKKNKLFNINEEQNNSLIKKLEKKSKIGYLLKNLSNLYPKIISLTRKKVDYSSEKIHNIVIDYDNLNNKNKHQYHKETKEYF